MQATGTVLQNRYRIVKLIAQGGFGAVYRAWDMSLSRACAVKENLETTPVAQQQFEREAKILANLNHPNLARVTDYFFVPGQGQYLVMDFVEGEDLQEMLDRAGRPLSEGQVLPWIGQVCDALEYLHGQSPAIIHRDIKPANIKITLQGKAMLVDFGIAKVYDPSKKTAQGARAVTPGYSPPEQYGQGITDARSDIYALGATLYTLLTGQAPPESIAISADQAVLRPARALNPALSPAVGLAVEGAMRSRPTQRYPSISEFRRALMGGVGGGRGGASSRKRWVWVGIGLGALALVALLCVAGWLAASWVLAPPETEPPAVTTRPGPGANLAPPTEDARPTPAATEQPQAGPVDTAIAIATQAQLTLEAGAAPPIPAEPVAVTPTAAPPAAPTPFAGGFIACSSRCEDDGSNAVSSFPGGAKALHLRWTYGNIPTGAHYVRSWTMDGRDWVRYDCTWPGPASGVDQITLSEPDGLHSGTWEVTIVVNDQVILREQVLVEGNWTYWSPAGVFNSCYGKK